MTPETEEELMRRWLPMAKTLARMAELRVGGMVAREDLAQYGMLSLLLVARRKREYSPKLAIRHGIQDGIRREFGYRRQGARSVGHGLGYALSLGMTRAGMAEAEGTMADPWSPRGIECRVDLARLARAAEVDARRMEIAIRHAIGETLTAIGAELGISQGRASQLGAEAIRAMRETVCKSL
jgi:hypothetical protein